MTAAWVAMDDARKASIRAEVLGEQPMLRRFPRLLEAACIDRAVREDAGDTEEPAR